MSKTSFSWKTDDKIAIHGESWGIEAPKAVICLVHGLGEHINRYDRFAAFFNAQGIAVIGFDHRGHGKSGGKRGHTPSYEALLDDVTALLAKAKTVYPESPLFLYGHSMGGNIVLNYLLCKKNAINGVIATGAAISLGKDPSKFTLALGRTMLKIFPSFTQPNGLNPNHLSQDKKVVEAYRNDPLVHNKVSAVLGLSILERGQWLLQQNTTSPTPLLLMHGADDQTTSPDGTKRFAAQMQGDVTLKIWDGLFHEIHNEPQQQAVFEFTLQWLENHLS